VQYFASGLRNFILEQFFVFQLETDSALQDDRNVIK
jgi:hypothetical protein